MTHNKQGNLIARNKNGLIFLDSIRHSTNEPDPTFHGRLDVASVKRREMGEDHYRPYIDYVPGRDM